MQSGSEGTRWAPGGRWRGFGGGACREQYGAEPQQVGQQEVHELHPDGGQQEKVEDTRRQLDYHQARGATPDEGRGRRRLPPRYAHRQREQCGPGDDREDRVQHPQPQQDVRRGRGILPRKLSVFQASLSGPRASP